MGTEGCKGCRRVFCEDCGTRLRDTVMSSFEKTISEQAQRIEELECEELKNIALRDYWEDKATELADDIGKALGFEVGEHSSDNCPVQNAIDGVYHMGTELEEAFP